jgi:predicted phosphodiesterase
MANQIRDKIVTFKSIQDAVTKHETPLKDAIAKKASELGGPWEQAAILARIGGALTAMEECERTEGGPAVLSSPQNDLAARMQGVLARSGKNFQPLPAGGQELKFATDDWAGWAWSWLSEWDSNHHEIVRPPSDGAEAIKDDLRIALISDWGTGLYGAPAIEKDIQSKCGLFDVIMHLGDVYYAGADDEMQQRFLDCWPKCPNVLNRALNGNHEMYSGGFAYFDKVLPAFKQNSSYFALQNNNWLLVALDTACTDFDLDSTQVKWLERIIATAGDRRVIIFSHHQLYSQLEGQGEALATKLGSLLHDKAIDFWYWGHEHRCVLYDVHKDFNLVARCIGHGGMPQQRGDEKKAPIDSQIGEVAWRKLAAKTAVPSAIILDGPNPYINGSEATYSPHGYMTIELSGKKLHETYLLPDGKVIRENEF